MRLLRVLLATEAMLLGCTDLFSVAAQQLFAADFPITPQRSSVFEPNHSNRRSLRVGTTDARHEHTNEPEERVEMLSKIAGKIQVRYWIETGKKKEKVIKLLERKGIPLAEIPNNWKFQKYMKLSESNMINKWIKDDVTTYEAWGMAGMQKNLEVKKLDHIQETTGHLNMLKEIATKLDNPAIKKTEDFRIYERFVKEFDDEVFRSINRGYDPPRLGVSTKVEMTARVKIMAQSNKSEDYAKVALGLTVPRKPKVPLQGKPLESNPNYDYYLLFLNEVAKIKAKS